MTTRYFRDFYGCTAKAVTHADGTTKLTISTAAGSRILNKTYGSYKGARIALGRYSEAWKEVTR